MFKAALGMGSPLCFLHSKRGRSHSGRYCDAATLRLIEWDCRRRDGLALPLVAHQKPTPSSAAEGVRRWRPEARSRTQEVERGSSDQPFENDDGLAAALGRQQFVERVDLRIECGDIRIAS